MSLRSTQGRMHRFQCQYVWFLTFALKRCLQTGQEKQFSGTSFGERMKAPFAFFIATSHIESTGIFVFVCISTWTASCLQQTCNKQIKSILAISVGGGYSSLAGRRNTRGSIRLLARLWGFGNRGTSLRMPLMLVSFMLCGWRKIRLWSCPSTSDVLSRHLPDLAACLVPLGAWDTCFTVYKALCYPLLQRMHNTLRDDQAVSASLKTSFWWVSRKWDIKFTPTFNCLNVKFY